MSYFNSFNNSTRLMIMSILQRSEPRIIKVKELVQSTKLKCEREVETLLVTTFLLSSFPYLNYLVIQYLCLYG